jgi:hypothetical protein
MDQVKLVYKQVREYWFWIACAVIFLFGLTIWFWVTYVLALTRAEDATNLGNQFGVANQVIRTGVEVEGQGGPYHPNDETHGEMSKEIATLWKSVTDAWLEQHRSQGERVFALPAELSPEFRDAILQITTRKDVVEAEENGKKIKIVHDLQNRITMDFVDAKSGAALRKVQANNPDELKRQDAEAYAIYERLAPTAKLVRLPIELCTDDANLLKANLRTGYGLYIRDELPELAKRINSNWMATTPEGTKRIVTWNTENQQTIASRHFQWNQESCPNLAQVLYSLEDLRVLEAIMDVIAETNKNATADYNAAVKRIDYIHLGSAAAQRAGTVMRLGATSTTTPTGPQPSGVIGSEPSDSDSSSDSSDSSEPSEPSEPSDPTAPALAPQPGAAADPADLRYVDLDYKPLPAAALRASIKSQNDSNVQQDPQQAKLAVAKRLPVRIMLSIDQRKLPELVAACGNSSLTIEVRQIRMNPTSTGVAGPSGATPSSSSTFGGFSPSSFGGYTPESSDPESVDEFGNPIVDRPQAVAATSGKDKNTQFDVNVELYGVVYIYNPVDTSKLGREPVAPPGAMAATPR